MNVCNVYVTRRAAGAGNLTGGGMDPGMNTNIYTESIKNQLRSNFSFGKFNFSTVIF